MSDLRETIASVLAQVQLDPDDSVETIEAWLDPYECGVIADRILAIPEIAEALAAKQREERAAERSDELHRLGLQTRNPAPNAAPPTAPTLGHSITVHRD